MKVTHNTLPNILIGGPYDRQEKGEKVPPSTTKTKPSLLDDTLAHTHRSQGRLVGFHRHTGATVGFYMEGHLTEARFQNEGIGNDADIGTQTKEGNRLNPVRIV